LQNARAIEARSIWSRPFGVTVPSASGPARFERFKEVFLDFSAVESIGQAFADEIFRVYATRHPEMTLTAVNANRQVSQMIRRATTAARGTNA
jgi:hypothetical protein